MIPPLAPPTASWARRLAGTGAGLLGAFEPLVSGADPEGRVAGRSRLLCAGLAELALTTYGALGGGRWQRGVAEAAALLSLLTKIDDQVIDDRGFHGGMGTDRGELRERTREYLDPTLRSLQVGFAVTDEPRCALAGELGRRLRRLGGDRDRREHLLDEIARGWGIQVDAVATFTAHPGEVDGDEVARVTRDISGSWLTMISLVGTLPDDAGRAMTSDEEGAILGYGGHIQRADALADLQRDVVDGLIATVPGLRSWQAKGRDYLDACATGDTDALYALTAGSDADLACLPGEGDLDGLDRRLAGLGELPSLLRWIHGFLAGRYLAHAACRREGSDPRFVRFVGELPGEAGETAPPDPATILAYLEPEARKGDRCSEH